MPHEYVDCPKCDLMLGTPNAHHACSNAKVIAAKDTRITELESILAAREARIAELEAVLREADEILALCTTSKPGLYVSPEVRALGRSRGFGAVMQQTSRAWADFIALTGDPPGAQHTCGPCEATVTSIRERIAAVLPPSEEG